MVTGAVHRPAIAPPSRDNAFMEETFEGAALVRARILVESPHCAHSSGFDGVGACRLASIAHRTKVWRCSPVGGALDNNSFALMRVASPVVLVVI